MHSYDPKLFWWSSSSPGFPWLPRLKMSVPLMSDRKNLTNVKHFLYQTYQMKDEDIWVSHLINLPTLWKAVFFVVRKMCFLKIPRTHQQKPPPHLAETDWTSRSYALIITVLGFPTASEYEIIGRSKKTIHRTGIGPAQLELLPPTKGVTNARQLVVEGTYLGSYILGCWELPRLTTGLGGGNLMQKKRLLSSQVAVDVECRCFFSMFLLWR